MNEMFVTLAMASGQGGEGQGGGGFGPLGFMVILFGIFYFMLIRPQQRKEKERKQTIENTKSGDRIMFAGGLLGTVTNVKEHAFVVKIADNVKIEIARGSVTRVLEKGDKIESDQE